MFLYDETKQQNVRVVRPDPETYFLLDATLHGTGDGLKQAMVYIRQAFMIHNETFHHIFMRLGANLLNDMERLAMLLHKEHGEDDRYYDESNDDTPVYEYILSSKDREELQEQHEELHHVNNDLTAAVMRNMEYEEKRIALYEHLISEIKDDGVKQFFKELQDSANSSFETLKNTLHILTTHTELKEFGEGNTHEAWDLDTSNYFDKPNPYFLTPDQKTAK